MKVFLGFIAGGSTLVIAFFAYETHRLWTIEPHEARATAVLTIFGFALCIALWRSFYVEAR